MKNKEKQIHNKTILLTGATGYLGGLLGQFLLENNYKLIALGLNHTENFEYNMRFKDNVKLYYLDEISLKDIFKNNQIDIIIHTATLYGRNNEEIPSILKANVLFPLDVLNLAIDYKVATFINTDTILEKNISYYSLTKRQFVDWLDMFSESIKVINLRLDHFYGPNDKPVKFVAWLIKQLKSNVAKIDLTEGLQTRDFIYIKDVLNVYKCILENLDKIELGKTNVFEVGTGEKISIKEFVIMLKKMLKNTTTFLNFGSVPLRKNEILNYNIDNSSLKKLGWKPKYNVKEGILDIIREEGLLK